MWRKSLEHVTSQTSALHLYTANQPEDIKLEEKTMYLNIDRVRKRSMQMKIFADFLPFQPHLRIRLGPPFKLSNVLTVGVVQFDLNLTHQMKATPQRQQSKQRRLPTKVIMAIATR